MERAEQIKVVVDVLRGLPNFPPLSPEALAAQIVDALAARAEQVLEAGRR